MQVNEMLTASGAVGKWLSIKEQFPEVNRLGTLNALTIVYYPIALLRMKLEEYSYEDFSIVEQSILMFYACGITTAEEICKWMSLPSIRYVQERLALLRAEGLIENGALTKMGKESLNIGQKKKLFDTAQVFQADGITGFLLPKDFQQREEFLVDRQRTSPMFPHLMHADSIALDTVRKAIEGPEKIRNYKRYRKSILNVNVNQVIDVQPEEIKYKKVMVAFFDGTSSPIVFFPINKRTRGELKRQCDMPLYVPRELQRILPEISSQAEELPSDAEKIITQFCELLQEEQKNLDYSMAVDWINKNTAFNVVEVSENSGVFSFTLHVNREDNLSPLDLEILASMGAETSIPVETVMSFLSDSETQYRKRVSFIPRSDEPNDKIMALSENWSSYGWQITNMAPISLDNALKKINALKNREAE